VLSCVLDYSFLGVDVSENVWRFDEVRAMFVAFLQVSASCRGAFLRPVRCSRGHHVESPHKVTSAPPSMKIVCPAV
jgi:hypothetical protein